MTISSAVRKAGPFAGNATATVFPFAFKVFTKNDIKVVRTDALANETTLVLDSDYSVALNTNQDTNPGGSITYPIIGSPLPVGLSLVLLGELAYDQPTDITNSGGFYPNVVEDMSDRSTIQIQQLAEWLSRAIVVTEAESAVAPLPTAPNRANRALVFNSLGVPGVSPSPYLDSSVIVDEAIAAANDIVAGITTPTFQAFVPTVLLNGPDFTAGTSQSVTLPAVTGKVIAGVFMDGVYQSSTQYTLNPAGTLLTFSSIIPAGISEIDVMYYSPGLLGAFLQNGFGAVPRAFQSKMQDVVSVKDFGVKGDGITDDTATITTAIAAAAVSGCELFFPPGTYLCSPDTPISAASPMSIRGSGKYSTIIKTTKLNAQIFSFSGQYISLRDFQLCGPAGASSGTLLNMNCIYEQVQRVAFINYFIALKGTGIIGSYTDCEWNGPQNAASIGWQIDGYAGGLNAYNAFMYQPVIQPAAGIQVLSVGGMLGVNLNIVRNGSNFSVQPPNGKQADSIQLVNCFLDSAQFANLFVAPQAGGIVSRMYLTQVECSSSDSNGMVFDGSAGTIDGVTIMSAQGNFCHANGITISGANAKNIDIVGGSACGNGSAGLSIGSNSVRVNNLVAGAAYGAVGNGVTGINLAAATSGVQLINCTLTGNGTGAPGVAGNIDGVQIVNCSGYVSANSGTSQIVAGNSSVVVTHGLGAGPVAQSILISPLGAAGSNPMYVDAASITATTFTVRTASAVGSTIGFAWRATCNGVS